jgi:hypothetical protein
MFKKLKLFPLNLRAFDGEGAGGGTGAGTAPAGTTGTPASSQQVTGEKVIYGKPPTGTPNGSPNAEGNKSADTPPAASAKTKEERAAEFEKLISGDYKDLYTERTQAMINKRFAATKELETKINAVNPLLDLLGTRYNEQDPAKLLQAVSNDDKLWESLADERGMSVEQYKQFAQLEADSRRLRETENQRQAHESALQQYGNWQKQALEMANDPIFKGFDLDAEAESNPQFVSLLKAGVDVRTAYQVSHIDDIKQATARAVEESVVNNIRAKGNRPAENGASGAQPQVVYKSDPSKLTREDRKEIEKRVARGEKITF